MLVLLMLVLLLLLVTLLLILTLPLLVTLDGSLHPSAILFAVAAIGASGRGGRFAVAIAARWSRGMIPVIGHVIGANALCINMSISTVFMPLSVSMSAGTRCLPP